MSNETKEFDLPTLDRLYAEQESGPWVAYSYEGESNTGRHRYSICRNVDEMTDHTCLGQLKADTEDKARDLAEYIAALHNTFPSLSARVKELEFEKREALQMYEAARADHGSGALENRIKQLEAENKRLKRERFEAKVEAAGELPTTFLAGNPYAPRIQLLEETLRGVLQEKQSRREWARNQNDGDTVEEVDRQIAWLESVLGGGK